MFIEQSVLDERIKKGENFRRQIESPSVPDSDPSAIIPNLEPLVPETVFEPAPVPDWYKEPERKARIDNPLPADVKAKLVLDSLLVGRENAALLSGVTPQEIQRFKTDPKIKSAVEQQKAKVREKAFGRLMKALDVIDDEKLEAIEDPLEAAQIAAHLSRVMEKAMPAEAEEGDKHVHFHIMQPPQKSERDYQVIEVGS